MTEMLTSMEGLGHALLRWLNVVVELVVYAVMFRFSCDFSSALVFFSLEAHQSFILFSLHSSSLSPSQFFLSKHKILKINFFQLKCLKFLKFKIYQNFKFFYPNTLLDKIIQIFLHFRTLLLASWFILGRW